MLLFLYRTKENDDDGDPLDWGAVRARTEREAAEFVVKRLEECGHEDEEFALYPQEDTGMAGIVGNLVNGDISTHKNKQKVS